MEMLRIYFIALFCLSMGCRQKVGVHQCGEYGDQASCVVERFINGKVRTVMDTVGMIFTRFSKNGDMMYCGQYRLDSIFYTHSGAITDSIIGPCPVGSWLVYNPERKIYSRIRLSNHLEWYADSICIDGFCSIYWDCLYIAK
jgi:hypothetical protein